MERLFEEALVVVSDRRTRENKHHANATAARRPFRRALDVQHL